MDASNIENAQYSLINNPGLRINDLLLVQAQQQAEPVRVAHEQQQQQQVRHQQQQVYFFSFFTTVCMLHYMIIYLIFSLMGKIVYINLFFL